MFEIEMKAHIYDRAKTEHNLFTYGSFLRKLTKSDTYYSKPLENPKHGEKDHISIRIRKEYLENGDKKSTTIILTYKQKEKIDRSDRKSSEINDEKECTLSDDQAIKSFLEDAGFIVSLKKTKIVSCFKKEFFIGNEKMEATMELCTLEELGDFLEIEVLSDTNETQKVNCIKDKILEIFKDLDIDEKDFETRYYSEMLEEVRKTTIKNR